MARRYRLETQTKGTGANIVPLEQEREGSATREPEFAVPRRLERAADDPAPKPPPRFRVVDVMTERVLADDASTRDTVAALAGVRSVVDVKVYVWNTAGERWRLLTQREQKALWEFRGAAADPARAR